MSVILRSLFRSAVSYRQIGVRDSSLRGPTIRVASLIPISRVSYPVTASSSHFPFHFYSRSDIN